MVDAPKGSPGLARLVLAGGLGLGLLVWISAIASAARQPDGSILTGVFAGLFGGLIVAGIAAWFAMRLANPPAPPLPLDEAKADRVTAGLGPVLAELEAARQVTVQQINARARSRVPLGAAAGVLFWLLPDKGSDPDGIIDLLYCVGFGAVAGYTWAVAQLGTAYRLLYKQRVLPLLAAQFGALSWRPAQVPDLARWQAAGVLPEHQRAIADDELFGTHRNLPVSIIELRLESHSGDDTTVHFNGLLTEVTLPRGLRGSTAVIANAGLLGRLRDWIGRDGRTLVRLEDPAFEAVYQVWSTDQIAARALLTPAFMERLLALAAGSRFGQPLAITSDNRLTMAIPRTGSLFEPPSYSRPAASRAALVALYDDIAAVLAVADAVIDLDYAARARAGDVA